jgi:hypothetical protein
LLPQNEGDNVLLALPCICVSYDNKWREYSKRYNIKVKNAGLTKEDWQYGRKN